MLTKRSLREKLGGGFGIVLLLTVGMAWFGWDGINNMIQRLNQTEELNLLAKQIYQARLHEQAFIQEQDAPLVDELQSSVQSQLKQVALIRQHSPSHAHQVQMDTVENNLHQYEASFLDYVAVTQQAKQAMETMRQAAQAALEQAEKIRLNQETQVKLIRQESSAFLQDKISKADDANQLLKWTLDLKALRISLLNKEDTEVRVQWSSTLQKIIALNKALDARFKLQKNKQQSAQIEEALQKYERTFMAYLEQRAGTQESQQQKLQNAVQAGINILASMKSMYELQKQQLQEKLLNDDKASVHIQHHTELLHQTLDLFYEARTSELAFLNTLDPATLTRVSQLLEEAINNVQELTELAGKAQLRQLRLVIQQLRTHQQGFQSYAAEAQQQQQQRTEQQNQLQNASLEALQQLQLLLQAQFPAQQADKLAALLATYKQIRHTEQNFNTAPNNELSDLLLHHLNSMLTILSSLQQASTEEAQQQLLQSTLETFQRYQQSFLSYRNFINKIQEQRLAQTSSAEKDVENVREQLQVLIQAHEQEQEQLHQETEAYVADKLRKAEGAYELYRRAADTRTVRLKLLSNSEYDADLVQIWEEKNQGVLDLANDLKTRFKSPENIALAQSIIDNDEEYARLFRDYLNTQREPNERKNAQAILLEKADLEAMEQMQAINQDQKAQLEASQQEMAALMDTKLSLAYRANQLTKWYQEALKEANGFIVNGDTQYSDQVMSFLDRAFAEAHGLQEASQSKENNQHASALLEYLARYKQAFQQVVKLFQASTEKKHLMLQSAQRADVIINQLLEQQKQDTTLEISSIERVLLLSAMIIVVLGIIVAWATVRMIIVPLTRAAQLSSQLARGNLAARAEIDGSQDETGKLLTAMNDMARDFQAVISQTRETLGKLAAGDKNIRVEGHFVGDFIEIRDALSTTALRLSEATEQNEAQSWLKTGQAQLTEQTSGEQDIIELSERIINFLTPYVNAQVGAFYLYQKEGQGKAALRMLASYAYTQRKQLSHHYELGEGLVGQAGLEKKAILITEQVENYVHIESGLGESKAGSIVVVPFMYEGKLKGAIELAAFHRLNPLELSFLEQVTESIAIAVNTAESRTQMRELLRQSQEQAELLQQQAADMEIQQQQLQESNAQMQLQQRELQQVNEELQTQSEELQTQSEELRQTNEELEIRSQELERQQAAIELKNSELEKAKESIQNKAEELELASKYKSEFLANMSHELRTPLNSLLILAQLLTENKEQNLSDKQIECARTIHSAGADLLNLINEILDLSKVEAGKIEIQPETIEITDLLSNLKQKFQHVAAQKNVEFKLEVDDSAPQHIYTDNQRLHQIINNLLSNAFKFTEKGSVSFSMRRLTAADAATRPGLSPENALVLQVQDTGIGIPKDKQNVIFEAFQQADGTTSRKYGGTGLGLSISRQLVQLMGGEIRLSSTPGEGSCFSVFLPEQFTHQSRPALTVSETVKTAPQATAPGENSFMQVKGRPEPAKTQQAAEATQTSGKEKAGGASGLQDDREHLQAGDKILLIIEDDRNFSKILMDLAHEKHFKCLMAEDGKLGLQLAREHKPNAIILDIGLPQADGWTVMEHLKEDVATRHIPVHFVSGYDHHMDARRMGAIGYSLKPVSMAELGEAFQTIDHFVNHTTRNLLIIAEDTKQEQILNVIGNSHVRPLAAVSTEDALKLLKSKRIDAIVLDVSINQEEGLHFLEDLCQNEQYVQIPVITYAERALTAEEDAILQDYADHLTIKSVYSPERLLDEATLFLHQVESNLPEEQREMLHRVYDKESILSDKKVLIVDDDMRNSFALATILSQKNMEVLMAAHGKEALEMLEHHPNVDLVLMDIMMPEMDGYEATQEIRKQGRFRKLPIIALTAKAMKGDRAKCIEAGANDYLAKPIDTDKLLSLMRVWLYQ